MVDNKSVEVGRSVTGEFLPGNKLQKRKPIACPITKEQMDEAIETVEANIEVSKGKKLLIQAVEWCYTDKDMMKFFIDRYVPKAGVKDDDIRPIQIIIERYYQAKDTEKDKTTDITP